MMQFKTWTNYRSKLLNCTNKYLQMNKIDNFYTKTMKKEETLIVQLVMLIQQYISTNTQTIYYTMK